MLRYGGLPSHRVRDMDDLVLLCNGITWFNRLLAAVLRFYWQGLRFSSGQR